jgi:putative endopeptidase
MRLNRPAALGYLILSALFACKPGAPPATQKDILAANLDTTVNPADDFFSYANGAWLKQNPIPDEYSSWGIGNLVQEELYERLRNINVEAAQTDPVSRKVASFWKSGMDSARIEQEGVKAIAPELEAIDAVKTPAALLQLAARLEASGVTSMISPYITQDDKNSEVMAFHLYQGGIGLPDRDYYFNTDERTRKIREAYPGHIARMLQFTGLDSAAARQAATDIVLLETRLAKASRKLEDLRDPYANYNKFSVPALEKLTPGINWHDYIQTLGVSQLDTLIVGQPEFYKALSAELSATDISIWKNYLKWHLINASAPYLSREIDDADFAFYKQLIRGIKKQKPRWKRVLDAEEGAMGEALGQLFVKEYFPEKAKKRYEDLVEDIRSALRERITRLTWMSDSTKQKALYKLSKIRKKVGYPDKWKDFSDMDIKDQPFIRNVFAANVWWHHYEINKLGKPVDRDEWDMSPQTYNAYYNPSNNEIVLPAGIFTVPGLRDEALDDALVYGYAGASTIGHEITHGFDDQGRQYDAAGNLKQWWTKEDEAKFNQRAAVMVKQFSNYVVVDTLRINGRATLGENIADLGGLLLGWDAFTKKDAYKKNETKGGLTPAQRFLLGYALSWMSHTRKESLARAVMTDVHSPARFRVIGPVSDADAFYTTYPVKPGNAMYLPDSARVRIW